MSSNKNDRLRDQLNEMNRQQDQYRAADEIYRRASEMNEALNKIDLSHLSYNPPPSILENIFIFLYFSKDLIIRVIFSLFCILVLLNYTNLWNIIPDTIHWGWILFVGVLLFGILILSNVLILFGGINTKNTTQLQQQYIELVSPGINLSITDDTIGDQKIVNINSTSNLLSIPTQDKQYDVFISHASEDKEKFVKPLVEALKKEGINVWYDEDDISWGDSIAKKIENGLVQSRYVIIVLSNSFLEKYWTNNELDGAMSREINGGKVILPIWHNISYAELIAKKPMLSGRLAIGSDKGILHIVDELKKILAN